MNGADNASTLLGLVTARHFTSLVAEVIEEEMGAAEKTVESIPWMCSFATFSGYRLAGRKPLTDVHYNPSSHGYQTAMAPTVSGFTCQVVVTF